ncbi:hypothetical protein MJO28_004454 [Puccinia striiformis f. sp. tritici]|uniref:Uncharacterized protein n=1 Tax=Puccinia striiformis f. sp. tritici TaxID=168172 RepID=A0ACC0ERA8_9BASI|nr:hypothetical protein MJO28_004454 [Puccinia striiformis f. sp. tritici]
MVDLLKSNSFVYKKEDDLTWVLEQLCSTIHPQTPSVILTNEEKALMNTIEQIFPTARNLLCQWHIGKNLKTHCKPILRDSYNSFQESWNYLLASTSSKSHQKNYAQLVLKCTPEIMDYLNINWFPLKD